MLTMPRPSTRRCRKCEWQGLLPGRRRRPSLEQAWKGAAPTRAALTLLTNAVRRMGETNEFYTDWTESYDSFDQMNLHENLLRGIFAYGACPGGAAAQ